MEYENKYASKGVGGTALGLAIGSLGAQLLGGGLGGLFGGNCDANCSENHLINRYELNMTNELVAKDSKIALLESNIYTDSKLNDLRNYVDMKYACVNDKIAAQAVHNATSDSMLACMQAQIAQLMSLTALRIPNSNICPGWGNVTITPAAAPTTGA